MVRRDESTLGENGGALQRVPQLANVAWPVVMEKTFLRVTRNARWRTAQRPADIRQKCLRQERQVLGSFTKWRQRNFKHVQTVIQVLGESDALDGRIQLSVVGRESSNVVLLS